MSEKIEDGGRAFPASAGDYLQRGMSLRDWFAGQALNGIASNPETVATAGTGLTDACRMLAQVAYAMADAMLKARGGQP